MLAFPQRDRNSVAIAIAIAIAKGPRRADCQMQLGADFGAGRGMVDQCLALGLDNQPEASALITTGADPACNRAVRIYQHLFRPGA